MTYNPNICTPTMFEDELRALASSASFVDPQLEARLAAVGELRRAIKAVREIPGWSGDSAEAARGPLERMEKNASTIETALEDLRTALAESTASVAGKAAVALTQLPSASADGFLADAGRNLAGVTDGWGVLDTGEAVAREEARLAAERESVAITKLKAIREELAAEADSNFGGLANVNQGNPGDIPLPVIDVEGIDRGIPPVGSNGPGATGPGGGGFPSPGSPAYPTPGGSYPNPGGTFPNPGGTYPNPGGTYPDPGGTYPPLPGEYPDGGSDDPSVDSPGGGILPGTPGGPGGWNPGGHGPGSGGPGGYLPGGGSGGSVIGGVGSGVGGAAALLGGRAMTVGGLGAAAGMSGAGGVGAMGGAAGGAPGSGRGLLGMSSAAGGSSASSSGAAGSASGSSAAGSRPGGMGMMGGAGAGDSEKKGGRSTLGGPIAPELDIEDDERPRSRGARAGRRNTAE